ncbi:MAG: DUF1624 domain-containing protein [Ruminococcus sp.]|jgi:uncharacterized membrane protein|nr:DUF1624 domain-containing protein [Ruminococcus sp.]
MKSENKFQNFNRANRVHFIDSVRGVAMIYIMLYHLFYDLIEFCGFRLDFFYSAWFELLHITMFSLLFFVSGVSTNFSRNSLKRGVMIFFIGQIITIITGVIMPGSPIIFGVLTFIGLSMMIYSLIKPLTEKIQIPWAVVFTAMTAAYIALFNFPHRTDAPFAEFTYPFGIMSNAFSSSDYFPLIPYFFVFAAGAAFAVPILKGKMPRFFYNTRLPAVNFIGRHSLIFYAVHQPVFIVVLYIVGVIK